jgi:hypothetical protein
MLLWLQGAALTVALPGPTLGKVGPTEKDSSYMFEKRNRFNPIDTSSPAGIAGGQVVNGAPPVSSFFADLRPPVRDSSPRCFTIR